MGRQFAGIEPEHRTFIERQKIFFVASAPPKGRVNVSPKGLSSLRVLGDHDVAYLDCTGSGSETRAHLMASDNRRLTFMFCAFEGLPNILRLYGRGRTAHRGGLEYAGLLGEHFGGQEPPGARQIVINHFDLAQTSCGYSVPLFDYVDERPNLQRWAEAKGPEGLDEYRREKNAVSLDGLPTGMFQAQ